MNVPITYSYVVINTHYIGTGQEAERNESKITGKEREHRDSNKIYRGIQYKVQSCSLVRRWAWASPWSSLISLVHGRRLFTVHNDVVERGKFDYRERGTAS